MEAATSHSLACLTTSKSIITKTKSKVLRFPLRQSFHFSVNKETRTKRVEAINDVNTILLHPAPVELSWQIIAGAIAGVTPFVVAGIEFSKRIIAQKRCEECGGSGLVLMEEKDYVRCPGCGGFLPWQSWKRFFSG
ncbi:hypothetical protein Lalb_Chr17g0348791 [Lupinus albus]|uniref:Viral late gene transcription factor 3 zinc ribbon domain-containing protein n=1 Tax=Lupinus albus TaxID=3870 RepID=A0A6A4P4C4_LUPAL|nr:hypothetical protein Lalb_Chr17g0348791 [Lupinus albus]